MSSKNGATGARKGRTHPPATSTTRRPMQSSPATQPGSPVRTDAENKLWEALHAKSGCTTVELSAAAGIGKSTAAKILAHWEKDGQVQRAAQAAGGRRNPDRWEVSQPDAAAPTASTVDPVEPASGARAAKRGGKPAAQPTATAADAQPQLGADEDADGATPEPKTMRLAPGALRGLVEDFLREHPADSFSPSQIGKSLNRSAGAVNNALEKLVVDGYAVQTQDKPKRFALKQDK